MDISSWITSALDGGTSAEDLAKQFTAALNKAEADRNGEKEREELLKVLHTDIKSNVAYRENITAKVVANVATIAIANKVPELRAGDLEDLHTSLVELVKLVDAMIDGDIENIMRQLGFTPVKQDKPVGKKISDADAVLKNFLREIGAL